MGSLEAAFYGHIAIKLVPLWFDAANAIHSPSEFGWRGAYTTVLLGLTCVVAFLWGGLAASASKELKTRLFGE